MNKGQETRNHILKESRKLFTARGFQRTSISEVLAATGVKKGNLYYHFQSKEELGLAVLLDAGDEFYGILDRSLQGETPIIRIINSCNSILELMQQDNFVGGCLFGNTALEMSDSDTRFGKIIRDIFKSWASRLEEELTLAAERGLLAINISAGVLATSIIAILEGGIMLSRVYNNKKSLEECIVTIRAIIEKK